MITKKTFVTSTSFILTAALLSQIYSFGATRFQPQSVNLSAFNKLAENISSVAISPVNSSLPVNNTVVTSEIIKVIDHEISKKIKRSRYIVSNVSIKKKPSKAIMAIAAVKLELPLNTELITDETYGYEINNKELITLYSFFTDSVEYSKFESMKLAENYSEEIIDNLNEYKDEVEVAQSSTENFPPVSTDKDLDVVSTVQPATTRLESSDNVKTDVKEIAKIELKEEIKEDEEMVMFDYSDKNPTSVTSGTHSLESSEVPKTFDQKLYERPISNTVKQAISREIGNYPIKRLIPSENQASKSFTKIDGQEIDLNSEKNTSYDYSQDSVKQTNSAAKKDAVDAINAFSAPAKSMDTHFTIKAKEINLNTHKLKQAYSFEFIPDYDRVERTDDHSNGEINLEYSLVGNMNTLTGVVQSQGMIPTRVELNFEEAKGIEVPLINEEGIQSFLQKQNFAIEGNLILLAIDSTIVDTEIDSKFAQRFYFNKNFKLMTGPSGASFVMYAGVKTGNILIHYLLDNKESAQKIVFVGEGEMFFDNSTFTASNRETYTFTTRNLMGQKRKELVVDGSSISFFNTNISSKKKALNAYEIKVPALASGMRKYLEFKHLKDTIFVGSAGEKDIEIPGNDFIGKVLEMNDVSSLKDRCVVQVNLTKDLSSIKANGKNRSGEMFVETSFLDKEGSFSRDVELADKVFIVGDMEGLLNVRLDYADETSEFLKTFCSTGTYIVEQL